MLYKADDEEVKSSPKPERSEEVTSIINHFELSEGALNVKILQNIYLKNLRFLSHEPEIAIANLEKVLILSDYLCGPSIKYKQS